MILGWTINTRRMLVSLPDDKFLAWSRELAELRTRTSCPRTELETLVGRLNHTAMVIMPDSRHFLSRIRGAMGPEGKWRHTAHISAEVNKDLKLWEEFLNVAHRGIPINLLVTRQLDHICWSDACPFGIGGYSITGRAWRIRVPKDSII